MTFPFFVFIASSLDGFIARRDGDIEWLNNAPAGAPAEDTGYDAFMKRIDTLVMGRGTFEKVMTFGFWPFEGKRVIVLSRTIQELPESVREKAELHGDSIENLLPKLQGSKGVYVDGGQVIQSFLRLDLIEEMTLSHLPVLLGSGLPLFGELKLKGDSWWQLVSTRMIVNTGLTQCTYRRQRK